MGAYIASDPQYSRPTRFHARVSCSHLGLHAEECADYEASLEALSKHLMPLVDYSVDEEGRMTVHNDTDIWYRYVDMTSQAEALFRL
jgi:hypothetical protein